MAWPLREEGYDVLAVDEERGLDGSGDEELLALAAEQARVLITFNAKDFALLVRQWAEAGRAHAGCVIFVGVSQDQIGVILRGLRQCLGERADTAWHDLTVLLGVT